MTTAAAWYPTFFRRAITERPIAACNAAGANVIFLYCVSIHATTLAEFVVDGLAGGLALADIRGKPGEGKPLITFTA